MKFNNKKTEKWLLIIALGGLLAKLADLVLKKKSTQQLEENIVELAEKEEKEAVKLITGKERFGKFMKHSKNIFKNFFIPHEGNNHKPKFLRGRSLLAIVILSLLVKVGLTGYMFFVYPNKAQMTEDINADLLTLINQDRKNNNLPELITNQYLVSAATAKANDMLAKNYFAHYSPDGAKPWDWINRSDYPYLYVGENLAMNFTTAQNVHEALMNSASHRKNILNEHYNDIGLAVLSGALEGEQTTVLVELFASQKPAAPVLAQAPAQPEETLKAEIPAKETTGVMSTQVTVVEKEELTAEQTPAEAGTSSETKTAATSPANNEIAAQEQSAQASTTVAAAETEPVINLEQGINQQPIKQQIADGQKVKMADRLDLYAKYFYLLLLALMIIALSLNIFIRINVQHKPIIIQTLLVILFIAGLVSVNLDIWQNIFDKITII